MELYMPGKGLRNGRTRYVESAVELMGCVRGY